MRELSKAEQDYVSGGDGVRTPNNIGGVAERGSIDIDISAYYNALVSAASRVIERAANAL